MMKPNSKEITFDWEHTEYHFIDPADLGTYDTVPNLEYGMKRTLVGEETEGFLKELGEDHESGAMAMAAKSLDMLNATVRGKDLESVTSTEEFWREFRMIAWHLGKNGRPSMGAAIQAALFRALESIRLKFEGNFNDTNLEEFKSTAELIITEHIAARQKTVEKLCSNFSRCLTESGSRKDSEITIATLSASGTITKCLTQFLTSLPADKTVVLRILESRPLFEGVSFANTLLSSLPASFPAPKVKVEIYSDASVSIVTKDADFVLLGADKVLANGDTRNKIGSLPLAIVAKTFNAHCKVLVVGETDKISASGIVESDGKEEEEKEEENDAEEVMSVWPTLWSENVREKQSKGFDIEVKNGYFDWIPAKYIDLYVSEKGVEGKEGIAELSRGFGEVERRLFDDL